MSASLTDSESTASDPARAGSIYPWEFLRHGRPLRIKVNGPLVFNDGDLILHAALSGLGIACAFEDQVASHIAEGRLVRVLTSWCAVFPGYHLYYPNRKQTSSALAVFVETLRSLGVVGAKTRLRGADLPQCRARARP